MEEKQSADLSHSLRQFHHQALLHHLAVVPPAEFPEGLGVMCAGDEGRHGLQRLTQYAMVRVILGCVLAQVLEVGMKGERRKGG